MWGGREVCSSSIHKLKRRLDGCLCCFPLMGYLSCSVCMCVYSENTNTWRAAKFLLAKSSQVNARSVRKDCSTHKLYRVFCVCKNICHIILYVYDMRKEAPGPGHTYVKSSFVNLDAPANSHRWWVAHEQVLSYIRFSLALIFPCFFGWTLDFLFFFSFLFIEFLWIETNKQFIFY